MLCDCLGCTENIGKVGTRWSQQIADWLKMDVLEKGSEKYGMSV